MLNYLSSEPALRPLFMRPELATRLAAMLNHFLNRLVGPSCLELKARAKARRDARTHARTHAHAHARTRADRQRHLDSRDRSSTSVPPRGARARSLARSLAQVADPEKYHFDPRQLLHQLGEIYVHFAVCAEFAPAIVADQRSYRHELFRKAASKVLAGRLREAELDTFARLAKKCQELAEAQDQDDEDLGARLARPLVERGRTRVSALRARAFVARRVARLASIRLAAAAAVRRAAGPRRRAALATRLPRHVRPATSPLGVSPPLPLPRARLRFKRRAARRLPVRDHF
jgi:hypothetical protein